jgi:small acid-soluble spore protein (thioredoxin-like protein)
MSNKSDDRRDNVDMRNKPDDRRDNVDRIQHNISNTIENIELAEEAIEMASDPKTKEALKAKNERREEALNSMRTEIRDEAIDKRNGYK